jgi:hypothetical protein
MAVRVSDRVWQRWRELAAQFEEPEIVLLFASTLSTAEAFDALRAAAGTAMRERAARPEPPPGVEEARTGHWSLAPVEGGVAIRIDEEPDDFEGLVRRIAEELDGRGVDGSFDVFEPGQPLDLPQTAPLLECRLRVRGVRSRLPNGTPSWKPEPEALDAAVADGVAWCVANAPGLPLQLLTGLVISTLDPNVDAQALVRQAVEATADVGVVVLTSAAPDRFRTLSVSPSRGRVTCIEGGAALDGDGWRLSLRGLTELLRSAARWAVYGFVKRGSNRRAAQHGRSLAEDWAPIDRFNPAVISAEAFEDELVPDAFGVQLLGPAHAGARLRGRWRETPIGADAVLLEHPDVDAWFDSATVPPDVLAAAREDLAPILLTRDDIG